MSTKSIRKKVPTKSSCNYHYIFLQSFVSKNLYEKKERKERILMVSIWRSRDMQSVSYLQGMFHNSRSL